MVWLGVWNRNGTAGARLARDSRRCRRADLGPDRFGQDARSLYARARRPRSTSRCGDAPRSNARRLRLAAQGAHERRARKSREATRCNRCPRERPFGAARRNSHGGSHRRYSARRASADAAQTSARARHHSRIALHSADRRKITTPLRRRHDASSSTRSTRWPATKEARTSRSRLRVSTI